MTQLAAVIKIGKRLLKLFFYLHAQGLLKRPGGRSPLEVFTTMQFTSKVSSRAERRFSNAGTPGVSSFKTMTLVLGFALAFLAISARPMAAEDMNKGSSTKASKKAATKAIPYDKLNQKTSQKISNIVKNASIYRRLPVATIQADPDLFVYLVRYPEVIVNIWQIMGATKMNATRTAPYVLSTNDGVGTTGTVDLVYGSTKKHLFYCEGQYQGPLLLRPVKARCVILMQTEFFVGRDGKSRAQNRLDIFLKIDNMAANAVAKTVHPLIGSTADHNFLETLKFVENLNATTVENGPGVQRLAQRLTKISPAVQQQFQQVAGLVYVKAFQGQTGSSDANGQVQQRNTQQMNATTTRSASVQRNANQDGSNRQPAIVRPVNRNENRDTTPRIRSNRNSTSIGDQSSFRSSSRQTPQQAHSVLIKTKR